MTLVRRYKSVSYAINVEPSAINYAQNIVTPLDSSYTYVPTVGSSLINFAANRTASDSHDYEWSASDNASDMNYMSICNIFFISLWLIPCCMPLIPLIPCIIYREVADLKSQKLKVTDTHVDFEHNRVSCCLSSNPTKDTNHISLKDIRSISYSKHKQKLDISYFEGSRTKQQSTIHIRGLLESSSTPGLIKDAIVQRRPKQPLSTSYTIPHITDTYKSQTISLNPHHNTIDYNSREKDTIAFIDGLGSIDNEGSRLVFWIPSQGRTRVHAPGGLTCFEIFCSKDDILFVIGCQPEIVVNFPDERSCSNFKLAVVASRDSLDARTTTTTAAEVISQSMGNQSHDFEWSVSDNPSEINCLPTCWEAIPLIMCIPCYLIMFPCIAYAVYNHWKKVPSQRLKITDTQIDFEHISPRCCCCLNRESNRTYHINLNDVRIIHNTSKKLKIHYFIDPWKIKQSHIEISGFVDSSSTPGLIKDAIIRRRPKQPQTTSYTIPHITNTYKSHTISLNPDTVSVSVDYKDRFEYVSFIDGLGSIEFDQSSCFEDSRLDFWSPPRGNSSKERPDMSVSFADDKSCLDFKKVVESSRNSFLHDRIP